jgi:hypothetical protein
MAVYKKATNSQIGQEPNRRKKNFSSENLASSDAIFSHHGSVASLTPTAGQLQTIFCHAFSQ